MVPTKLEDLKCPKQNFKLFIFTLNYWKEMIENSSHFTKYKAIAFNI